MYGAIVSVLIVFTMLFIVITKARKYHIETYYLKKSEISNIIDTLSDDEIIGLLIERNSKWKIPPK